MEKHPLLKARDVQTDLPVLLRGTVAKNHPLKKWLQQVPQTFSTQGEIEYDLGYMHMKVKAEDKTTIDCGTLWNPDVSKLLEASLPSPFGKGEKTIFDENVRKGKEIKADQIEFCLTKSDAYGDGSAVQCLRSFY
jgi:hypothetical protein